MSSKSTDPLSMPEWQALHREASLVSQIIGSGVTALGRASYGSGLGEYYLAFFGLSIGIERLAKLILVADYALANDGSLPDQQVVKRFGHNLNELTAKADQIATCHQLSLKYQKPQEAICCAALACLDSFAHASRYANFEAIGNPAFNSAQEPINIWWAEVVEPILTKHYCGNRNEAHVCAGARANAELMGSSTFVSYIDERGQPIHDLENASERTGQTKWAQKYGRFYTLCIVRWLSHIFVELTRYANGNQNMAVLFGHSKWLVSYTVENRLLLNRKSWPLT